MAEENTSPNPEGKVDEPQLSPVEQKALEQGWRPKDQWDGDEDSWRPAKEFLDRGELFKKIDAQNQTIRELKKTQDALAKHNARIAEVEYKRALETLKKQKRDALAEGNADAVMEIDERIDDVKQAQREVQAQPAQTQADVVNPVFNAWVEKNNWYNTNKAMRAFANEVGREYAAQGLSPVEALERITSDVKKEFADKFSNPRRTAPGAVEGATKSGKTATSDRFELTDDERRAMDRFVKQGIITKEKYIEQIKATR